MGATGSGKSSCQSFLATRFFPSEIINSDKIQISRGLDITTNKISMPERRGVVHHLLGEFPSESHGSEADNRISDIINRRKLPLIVGGSNSFIYALLSNRFNRDSTFSKSRARFVGIQGASLSLLLHLGRCLNPGCSRELEEFFGKMDSPIRTPLSRNNGGLRKAIGVPEMEGYFRKYKNCATAQEKCRLHEEAVTEIKENTRQLAEKQMWKEDPSAERSWVGPTSKMPRRHSGLLCRLKTARFRRRKFGKDKL
ncbi:Adenylate isopentenyltransferase [Datura stramonium]|uniref:Adenylate isopentenyltransferase n=1 Tax=Datura stramonium TaxID=4076 RepID=A0ABS8TNJ8_DATST|nr:Adenylate isopentenyltransferase [Datura stramonium]